MKRPILVDTGPLLALFDARDQYHHWTCDQFSTIEAPLLTCEAVLTEASFLCLRRLGDSESLLRLVDLGAAQLAFALDENWIQVRTLLRRYASVPMSLADACLVRMSELMEDCSILTLDSDFKIYRRHGRKVISLISPLT